jgi:hypothetical protein
MRFILARGAVCSLDCQKTYSCASDTANIWRAAACVSQCCELFETRTRPEAPHPGLNLVN